jgi:hypothetical protein
LRKLGHQFPVLEPIEGRMLAGNDNDMSPPQMLPDARHNKFAHVHAPAALA